MNFLKGMIVCIVAFALVAAIFVGIGLLDLEWQKYFSPKRENIRRQVFENTQSYTHGKVQDLAKYYEEYNAKSPEDREAIRTLIVMRFAEFDDSKINSVRLRNFLIEMRGY